HRSRSEQQPSPGSGSTLFGGIELPRDAHNVLLLQRTNRRPHVGNLHNNLPPTTQGHTVTISVSLYSSQYGNLIGATSETFQAVVGNQQVVTTTVTQPYQYPYQTPPSTPYAYQPTYPNQAPSTQQPSQQHPYQSQYQTPNRNNPSLISYVAIVAILAAVVIATAGLVVYGRRRQQPPSVTWVPAPPPPR